MEKYLIADFNEYDEMDKKYGREPVISIMPDGSLVCVMLTGGPTEPYRDNFAVICKSRDGGKTWSLPKKLFSHKSRGVWCTEIYTGFDRPMLIVHTYNGECPYKELQTFVSYTDDNGETWSNPVSIAPYANGLCVRKGIKMSNGETLFPIYHTHLNDGFGEFPEFGSSNFWINTYHSCGVIISADEGKLYMPYGNLYMNNNSSNNAVDPEGNSGTSLDLWEPNCVEVESGHIVMYMRSSGIPYIISAESFDFGRTWTYKGNTNIPNANSKISLQTVRDKVLMVSNTCTSLSFNDRRHLQINISADRCRTWVPVSYIEGENGHFFYPHIAVDEENEIIYIAYEDAVRRYVAKYTFSELGL